MVEADSPALATVAEMAKFLRVDQRTVRRYCKSGVLPAVRVGGMWRVDLTGELATIGASERGRHPVKGRIR